MSAKQFITAQEHLAKLGITVQQALDFIETNVDQPDVIYSAARQNGVTNEMLNEITTFSTTVISEYFVSADLDPVKLDYTSILANFDLATLETLVGFNNNTGVLSNASLGEAVRPLLVEPLVYDFSFDPIYSHIQPNDGIYDAEELGVGHLSDVPATNESVESLFYGSLINMFSMLDESELNEIDLFPKDDNPEGFQVLLLEALSDSSSTVRTDEQVADLVIVNAAQIVDTFWVGDFVGILDHSYLGLATA